MTLIEISEINVICRTASLTVKSLRVVFDPRTQGVFPYAKHSRSLKFNVNDLSGEGFNIFPQSCRLFFVTVGMLDNEGNHQKQTENGTLHTSIHYCTVVAMTQLDST